MTRVNALIAHGGGPTAVINASLAGLVEECRKQPNVAALYGAQFGMKGVLEEKWTSLLDRDPELIRSIGESPGSAQ